MTKYFWMMMGLALTSQAFAAKRALVYNGPGACAEDCASAAFQVAILAGLDPVYVNGKALDAQSSAADVKALFQDAVVWLEPGGKSKTEMTSISAKLKSAIDDFVKAGGGYVGFCAGAFSSTQYVGETKTLGFSFMPGKTMLYPEKNDAAILPLNWAGKTRHLYWEGGPYIAAIPPGKAEVVATYPDGTVAAARSVYGNGKVFVTGVHPEAPEYWRDYYHLQDSDGLDQDLAVDMINWVTGAK